MTSAILERVPGRFPARSSRAQVRTGRMLTGVVALFLLLDAGMKLARLAPAVQGTTQLGYPESSVAGIGLLLLGCLVLYLVPRSAVLGALLLTGYLGGAIASQMRVGNPLFSHVLFPAYLGVAIWVALLLRDARLRAFLPSRRGDP